MECTSEMLDKYISSTHSKRIWLVKLEHCKQWVWYSSMNFVFLEIQLIRTCILKTHMLPALFCQYSVRDVETVQHLSVRSYKTGYSNFLYGSKSRSEIHGPETAVTHLKMSSVTGSALNFLDSSNVQRYTSYMNATCYSFATWMENLGCWK